MKQQCTWFAYLTEALNWSTMSKLPPGTVEAGRLNEYQPVLQNHDSYFPSLFHACSWFAALSFFTTPAGIWSVCFGLQVSLGFANPEGVKTHPWTTLLRSTAILSILSISTFFPFARCFDFLYLHNASLRCQPKKAHDVSGYNRSEVKLAALNLVIAAFLTAVVGVSSQVAPELFPIYLTVEGSFGYAYMLLSTILYFLWIDAWAYLSHRLLHFPKLYKAFHKWHHAYRQPTAFTALALHPFDFVLFQGGVYMGMLIIPMSMACIIVNLFYIHYYNVIHHSGVYLESFLPWESSSLFHDDHHRFFHVNYGQTLTFWDKMGGTLYTPKKKYSESTFSY